MNGRLDYRLTLDESDYVAGIRNSNNNLAAFRRSKASTTASAGAFSASMLAGAGAVGVLTAAVVGGRAAFLQFAQFDRIERALAATMGSADAAAARLRTLKSVAREPGLGLEEAAKGDLRLQAVGISAARSERILRSVGNALASAGAGKAELDGVTTALSQMAAKGVVSAEEINQIAERMPQIRKAMTEAFGTADTTAIQAMKISVDDFVDGVVTQLEKLPKASGGAANAIENLDDSWKNFKASVGGLIAPVITPVLQGLGDVAEGFANMFDGVDLEEAKRLAEAGAKYSNDQADAAKERAAAEREAAKALADATREAKDHAAAQERLAEAAERQAAAAREARAAALQQGTTATRRIVELTTPEPELVASDLAAAMAKARSEAQFVNRQVRPVPAPAEFTARDLETAINEEKDLEKKARMRALLAEIVALELRKKELAKSSADEAKRAADETARSAKAAKDEADARGAAAADFETEGKILAAKASGNAKLVEQLEREAKVRALTLDIIRQQGVAEATAAKMAADRVALEEAAANPRKRGLATAEESARRRFDRMSDRDKARRGGTFEGFLEGDRTTRNSLADRARQAARAAAAGAPGGKDPGKPGAKLETLAQKQQATLESIDDHLARLSVAT